MSLVQRRIGIVAGLLILAAAGYGAYFMSSLKEPPGKKEAVRKVRTVDTMQVFNTKVATSLPIQGELQAYDKIDIFSEVSGTLEPTERPFKVGSFFPKGSVLIKVDQEEARLGLLSQKSTFLNAITQMMPDLKIDYPDAFPKWRQYLENFDLEKKLAPLPEPGSKQEKLFVASRNIFTQYYNIKSTEERLDKYTLFAPFSGVITEAAINPGAVVRAGQKLGELMNTSRYELEATIPLSDLKYIDVGNSVTLASSDIDGEWKGRIRRINDRVDPNTQTVKVFIGLSGKGLREGMYLTGLVKATDLEEAVEIPRDLLIDQRAVYVVEDSILSLREVEVLRIDPDGAVVRGLSDGAPLLREPFPGIFDGMKVELGRSGNQGNAATRAAAEPVGMR